MTTTQAPADLLAYAFQFGSDDLIANRNGRLTDYQRERLEKLALPSLLKAMAAMFLILILFVFLFPIASQLVGGRDVASSVVIGLLVLAGLALPSLSVFRNLKAWYQSRADANGGIVERVAGALALEQVENTQRNQFTITINQQDFQVDRLQYMALEPDRRYALYITPQSRQIVSIELLRANPRLPR